MRRNLRGGKTQGRVKNYDGLKLTSGSNYGNEGRAVKKI